jgi:hypothetical protein
MNLLQHPGLNYRCEITAGVLGQECAGLLQAFSSEPPAQTALRTKRARNSDFKL